MAYSVLTYMPDKDDIDKVYKDILGVVMLFFCIKDLAKEGAKLWRRGLVEYLSSGWNTLNVTTSTGVCCIVMMEYTYSGDDVAARRLAAGVTPLIWLQTFNYLRGFRGTGALVRMIIQIMFDIKYFSLIMIIMTIAF